MVTDYIVEQEKLKFPPSFKLCSNNYQRSQNILFDDPAKYLVKEEKEEQGTSCEGEGKRFCELSLHD